MLHVVTNDMGLTKPTVSESHGVVPEQKVLRNLKEFSYCRASRNSHMFLHEVAKPYGIVYIYLVTVIGASRISMTLCIPSYHFLGAFMI